MVAGRYDRSSVRRLRTLEPMRLLSAAVAAVFLLLLAGLGLAIASGSIGWQGALTGSAAAVIAASGLLYAWRLGAPGRRG
jgi:hypothetical protein